MLSSPNILPAAHASSEPPYCSTIGGSWDSSTSTCTLSTNDFASPDTSLEVTSGTILLLDCSSSCGTQLLFESNGTLTVDQGAAVYIETNFSCSSNCFDNGIDLDGSHAGISNQGMIVVEPSLGCTAEMSFCFGIDSDGATINNTGIIQIGGNYSCGSESLCGGILKDNGNFVDINCGTTSPQTSPYVYAGSVTSSGGCDTTTLTQTINDTATLTQTNMNNSTFTQMVNNTLIHSNTFIESDTQTVTTTHSVTTSISEQGSNITVTKQTTVPSSSSDNYIAAVGIAIGVVATAALLFARKRP